MADEMKFESQILVFQLLGFIRLEQFWFFGFRYYRFTSIVVAKDLMRSIWMIGYCHKLKINKKKNV